MHYRCHWHCWVRYWRCRWHCLVRFAAKIAQIQRKLSGVIDTAWSWLSGVNDTAKSWITGVIDTSWSKLSGVIDTAELLMTPLSQFLNIWMVLPFFKVKIRTNPSMGELYYLMPTCSRLENRGLTKHKILTKRCHWHRLVNFNFEYLGEFETVRKKTLGGESAAQGEMFDEKNQSLKISWDGHFNKEYLSVWSLSLGRPLQWLRSLLFLHE